MKKQPDSVAKKTKKQSACGQKVLHALFLCPKFIYFSGLTRKNGISYQNRV